MLHYLLILCYCCTCSILAEVSLLYSSRGILFTITAVPYGTVPVRYRYGTSIMDGYGALPPAILSMLAFYGGVLCSAWWCLALVTEAAHGHPVIRATLESSHKVVP